MNDEVLSAHGISQNVSRVPGMQSMLGSSEMPETGAFDFLNYLLGLQVNSAQALPGQEGLFAVPGEKTEKAETEDPLKSLFQKKELPLWNPMVPAGETTAQRLLTPTVKVENVDANQSAVSFNELKASQTTQKKETLENRFLEPQQFLETRAFGEKSVSVTDSTEGVSSEKTFQDLNGPNRTSKNQGIEKYHELVQMKNQRTAQFETTNPETLVKHGESNGRIEVQLDNTSKSESKSSEKRRDIDPSSVLVAMQQQGPVTKGSEGGASVVSKAEVKEKSTLPEVFQRVETLIHHGGGKMTVELTPPELGKLEVDVVTKGNHVEVKMRSDNEIAKVALEGHMGELKSAMEGQNLNLHKVEVQVGLDGDMSRGSQFAFMGQGQQQSNPFSGSSQQETSRQSFHRTLAPAYSRERDLALSSIKSSTSSRGNSGVDIRI